MELGQKIMEGYSYYKLPFEQWLENYEKDFSQYIKTKKGGKLSISYVTHSDMVRIVREHAPEVDVVLVDINKDDDGVMLKLRAVFNTTNGVKLGNVHHIPVTRQGPGQHSAIMEPDVGDISNSLKRAIVRVYAEETGLTWKLWSDDGSYSDEAAEPAAQKRQRAAKVNDSLRSKASKAKTKRVAEDDDDDEEEEELDFDLYDDDDEDDDEEEAPRKNRTKGRSSIFSR